MAHWESQVPNKNISVRVEITIGSPREFQAGKFWYIETPLRMGQNPFNIFSYLLIFYLMASQYFPTTIHDTNSMETIHEKRPADIETGYVPVNAVKRTMGNPSILGLWSFGMVTILLGTYNLFLPTTSNHIIFPSAFMFGGLAQYIAG